MALILLVGIVITAMLLSIVSNEDFLKMYFFIISVISIIALVILAVAIL